MQALSCLIWRRCCGILVGSSRCDFPPTGDDYEATNKREKGGGSFKSMSDPMVQRVRYLWRQNGDER